MFLTPRSAWRQYFSASFRAPSSVSSHERRTSASIVEVAAPAFPSIQIRLATFVPLRSPGNRAIGPTMWPCVFCDLHDSCHSFLVLSSWHMLTSRSSRHGRKEHRHGCLEFHIDGDQDVWLDLYYHSNLAPLRYSTSLQEQHDHPQLLISGGGHHWDSNALGSLKNITLEPQFIQQAHLWEIRTVQRWMEECELIRCPGCIRIVADCGVGYATQ